MRCHGFGVRRFFSIFMLIMDNIIIGFFCCFFYNITTLPFLQELSVFNSESLTCTWFFLVWNYIWGNSFETKNFFYVFQISVTSLFLLQVLRILISQRATSHDLENNRLPRELIVTFDFLKNIRTGTTIYYVFTSILNLPLNWDDGRPNFFW